MASKRFLPQPILAKIRATYAHLAAHQERPEDRPVTSLREFLEITGRAMTLAPGEILFTQDEIGESMYWIESGALAVLQGPLDEPRLLTFRHPGQIVGEIALLEDVPRTATVAAVRPTRLKALNMDKFQALLGLIPDVGVELIRLLSARLYEVQPAEYGAGYYDHLTGALSRQAFDERLQQEIERARLYRYGFSLVFLDLDHFKEVNDTYGHARGDEVLIAFVERVGAKLRATDLLFRYGGDEFVLILPGIDAARGATMTQDLLMDVQATPVPGDPPVFIAFSAGIAFFPDDGENPEVLLAVADQRVYTAKRGGRGQVSDSMPPGKTDA
ncbi:MAG: GGDEF domain-containing protein [Anaerolineales bacterium]|nr:GGDEF domain-containing protein [Anaerolineales bacterium]